MASLVVSTKHVQKGFYCRFHKRFRKVKRMEHVLILSGQYHLGANIGESYLTRKQNADWYLLEV